MFRKKNLFKYAINPDEIFVDSKNIPDFDKYQFEGRLEKPIKKFTFIAVGACFFILGSLLFLKIFQLQVINGKAYSVKSEQNYLRLDAIFPSRGVIYDRNGKELAWNEVVLDDGNLKPTRVYNSMPGLAHVLGYIGIGQRGKVIGIDGVEKKQESVLGGANGIKIVEVDSQNKIKSESVSRPAESGKAVNLTIDSGLQSEFHKILGEIVESRGFNGGGGVILDIASGETLAIASYPEYDSQILSKGKQESSIKEFLNNPKKPFVNRAVSGLYSPGSIIKPLIAVAALKEKIISSTSEIFSSGSISLPNPFFPEQANVFKDWKAHGWVDMRRALAVSSNVYFYTVGGGYENIKGLGIGKISEYANLFGFGSKTGIDIDKEEEGLVPTPELKARKFSDPAWRIGDTYNASIGQGDFQITPIQAAVYVAAIANNGRLLQPYIVQPDVSQNKEKSVGKILEIPEEYFQVVKEGMRRAVLEGTAQGLSGLGVAIAAKTGTAELESQENKFVNSWIIGFAPYEKPKIVFSIVLEKGRVSNLIGGVFAARRLFEWILVHKPEYLSF